MGCGTSFVKYVLFFFNLFIALVGLGMIGVGVAVLVNWRTFTDVINSSHVSVAPWFFIVLGAIVFIIAFFGCCGSIRESHCMVVTYAIFLLVLIIIQVVLAVLLFVYSENIQRTLSDLTRDAFEKSKTNQDVANIYHTFEQQAQCCGAWSPNDYNQVLPPSCCPREQNVSGTCPHSYAYNIGCAQWVRDSYQKWDKVIASVAIGVACVEIVGALFALCLANSIRNMDRRSRY